LSINRISNRPEFLAISTGMILGFSFFLLKIWGLNGGLALFGASSLIVFFLFSVPIQKFVWSNLINKQLIWRGFIFGSTQILICESINRGTASGAMSASILGSVAGMACGRLFLNEDITGRARWGSFISVAGSIFCLFSAPYSLFACVAGGLIGVNSTLTRSILKDQSNKVIVVMTVPLLYGGVLMTVFELLRFGSVGFSKLSLSPLLWFVICLILAQYLTCVISRSLDSQRTAALTLVRLPTIAALELVTFGKFMPMLQLIGLIFVSIGATWLFVFCLKEPILSSKTMD
jgi:drug/metabolite transporter (DMT)-like permease